MPNNQTVKGSCLCGTVGYEFLPEIKVFQYCHCSRCRKFTGAAHGANIIVAPEHFTWTRGEEKVGRFELPNVNHFATSFCKSCGSSLPWKTQSGKGVVIPAGTLDDDPGVKPKHNIFYKSRAPWYTNVCDIAHYDELPTK